MGFWRDGREVQAVPKLGTCGKLPCGFIHLSIVLAVLIKPQVHDLKYSNAGDKFLVISGTSQAKLYERDGEEVYVRSRNVGTSD